ncbi:MAG: YeeE/YedE family protein [Deltaproteobacteria bacterium]|nr:YeeE/YedE family protein [Deltaproteobacteria bacterium]MBW2399212.1 YeeE/YedE family protein [Deltaproteobacteria bacterium]MBW2666638.1 YeeE/YedE family protein [Deltaproteobacteria bacterium]
MTAFTPWSALLGGAMIGTAALLLWVAIGRIAGVSGILAGALFPPGAGGASERSWRAVFLLGLPLGALLTGWAQGGLEIAVSTEPIGIIVAGLLVGFGTQLGSGCTSGHGVCGIGRGSKRSIAATLTFMTTGALTVYLVRHLLGGGS